jgi:hypothetical protein
VKRQLTAPVSTSCKLDDVKKVTGVTGNCGVEQYCSSSYQPGFHSPQLGFHGAVSTAHV